MTRYIVYYDKATAAALTEIVEVYNVNVVARGSVLSYFVIETDNIDVIKRMRASGLTVEEVVKVGLIKPIELE